ncbi:MAG: hypothetical protein OHK0011_25070 [Turneriella sp.]
MKRILWIALLLSYSLSEMFAATGAPAPVAAAQITSLASADGHTWYAQAGHLRPEPSKPELPLGPHYQQVEVPANLAPQIKASGRAAAHYRMRFVLDKAPVEPMALRLGEINDRDVVYLNGVWIGKTGEFDAARPQAYDKVRVYAIPAGVLKPGTNELIINVQGVLENESGLYRDRVELGPAQAVWRAYYLEMLWSLLALVCYLTFGLYFLLFFIRRRHDREKFYFAVFAIALVVYSGLHTQLKYEYGLPLYVTKKIQYLALFLLVPAFYFFIRNYYRLPQARWLKVWDFISYAANAVMVTVSLVVLFSPDVRIWDSLHNNVVTYLWLVYIAGMAIILLREALAKDRDAIIMLVSFFVLLAAMLLDILSGRAIINLPPLLTYVFILFILSMALVLANRFVRLHDETEQLNESLSQFNRASRRFVPFEFLEMLEKKSITDVSLGDQVQREMAVLFSDIRSFTALSEKMSPKENFDFINSYLDRVGPVIREHNGFIDKYIGDAVMALFPRSAQDALDAALAMHLKVAAWNEKRRQHGYEPVAIGIGVHWGRVMLGTIGEHERMDGTVISDAVNLASRIESLTKQYGAGVLISDIAWQQIANPESYKWRLVDRVAVQGKKQPIDLIEIFDADDAALQRAKELSRQSFAAAVELYRAGKFQDAKTAFLSLMASYGADRVFRLYLDRIEHHLVQPPEEWCGFDMLTEK